MAVTLINPGLWFTWAPGSGILFSHAVAQCCLTLSDTGVCVIIAFHTIMLIESVAEPVSALSPIHTKTLTSFDHPGAFSHKNNPVIQCRGLFLDKTMWGHTHKMSKTSRCFKLRLVSHYKRWMVHWAGHCIIVYLKPLSVCPFKTINCFKGVFWWQE